MGRPKIVVDWKLAEKLASIHCTKEEISDILGISHDTFERRIRKEQHLTYALWYKKHSAKGKMSLRRKQFEVATSGNVAMLIWLGKQCLEQKDVVEATVQEDTVKTFAEIAKNIRQANVKASKPKNKKT